jgi:hypothetical protein
MFFSMTGSIAQHLDAIRKLYEIGHIANQMEDGKRHYPEDENTLRMGINVEFRYVSFSC